MSDNETIAEVLCNLWGCDPNDDTVWEAALDAASQFTITGESDLVIIH